MSRRDRLGGRGILLMLLAALGSAAIISLGFLSSEPDRRGQDLRSEGPPPHPAQPPSGGEASRTTSPWQAPALRAAAERRAAVAALLDARAAAVLADDRDAWLDTVDPSDPEAIASESARVTSLVDLPVQSWTYALAGADRPGTLDGAVDGREARWTAPVVLRYRLTGVDVGEVVREQAITVVRRDGSWKVSGSGPRAPVAGSAQKIVLDLWDMGPVTVAEGSRSVVVARGEQRDLSAYVAEADAAAIAVDAVWGTSWPRRVAVLVPANTNELSSLLPDTTPGLERVAAVTTGRPGSERPGTGGTGDPAAAAPGPPPASGDRVVVNPPAWKSLSPLGRQIVMTHETTHVATRATDAGPVPMWLSEGFADYVGYRAREVPIATAAPDLLEQLRTGQVPAGLPKEAEFDASSPAVGAAYEGSWLACRLLAQRLGEPALVELYQATARTDWKTALRERTGLEHPQFVALWQAELTALAQGAG